MKNYDGKEEPSFLVYLDANNLHGSAMYEKLPVRGFKWVRNVSRIDEDFIKNYYKNGDIEFILDVDIEYPKELHDLHNDLSFLPKRIKVNKCNKLVCNLYDKYVVHKRALKQALKHGLKLKKVPKAFGFYQEA